MTDIFLIDRFYQFWERHCGSVRVEVRDYFIRCQQIIQYGRNDVIKAPADLYPYVCVVLDGIVGSYKLNRAGTRVLREVVLPMDYFTGTSHMFTDRHLWVEHIALKRTVVIQVSLTDARRAIADFREVSELSHILKQRKITRMRYWVEIFQEDGMYDRYARFREVLPEVAMVTTGTVQAELLHMSLGHLKKLKTRYVRSG